MLVLLCSNAGAQTHRGEPVANWYVDLDAGYRARDPAWIEGLSKRLYDEAAAFDVHYRPSTGAAFGAQAGRRMWKALAVGVGVTRFRTETRTQVTGSVPHPLFFRRPRELEHTPESTRSTELGVHLHIGWTFRITERLDLRFTGGPSWFDVKRYRLTSIDTSEVGPPYGQVTQAGDVRAAARRSFPGANAGVDLTYYFWRRLDPGSLFWKAGVGGFVRWAGGTVDVPELGVERWTVGSWRGGLGFRLRF